VQHQRRHDGQQHGCAHNRRGVDSGKTGNEALGARLFVAGIFHQLQNARYRRFGEGLGDADADQAGNVDTAGDDLVALGCIARQGFAGQRRRVERRFSLYHHAVQRNLFARLDHDDVADLNLFGIDLFELAVPLNVGVIGADVHQGADGFAALAHRIALEQLANLVKQHNSNTFTIITKGNRAYGCYRHQKILVKHLMILNTLAGLDQNIISDNQIRNHK